MASELSDQKLIGQTEQRPAAEPADDDDDREQDGETRSPPARLLDYSRACRASRGDDRRDAE